MPLFALALFVGAGFLFLTEPIAARMVLPRFGGTPAVWNTSMLFFQAALLAGYAYAHFLTGRFRARPQAAIHLVVIGAGLLAVPLVTLPLGVATLPIGAAAMKATRDWAPGPGMNPVVPLLGLLCLSVGVPFFVLSATAPVLQRWFAATGHRQAHDPYFLYAASNAGSLLALLAYPTLVEPHLTLQAQGRLWALGYLLLGGLMAACARIVYRQLAPIDPEPAETPERGRPLGWPRRLRWLGLAFVPSSLMLGVTTYATTDVAPMPLLWVVPLALYLVTFILAFSHPPTWVQRLTMAALPAFVLVQVFLLLLGQLALPVWLELVIHLAGFFVAALYCHGELARDRPEAGALTEFYLWVSAGGALGGVLNALVAPVVFSSIVEYPLVVLLAFMLDAPVRRPVRWSSGLWEFLHPVALGLVAGLLVVVAYRYSDVWGTVDAGREMGFLGGILGTVAAGCWLVSQVSCRRPLRFGLGAGAVLAWVLVDTGQHQFGTVVLSTRSFFGVHRVAKQLKRVPLAGGGTARGYITLVHGGTAHGREWLGSDGRPVAHPRPLTYYHPTGPAGQLFCLFQASAHGDRPVAVVGLGAGSLAAYASAKQEFVFYEIDPTVERIARDQRFFTFLSSSPANCRVVLGDGRLSLVQVTQGSYGLIVLDAFSSDAVPVHLLTREALRLYLDKLAPGGLLAFHLSNRYLALHEVTAALAADAGLVFRMRADFASPAEMARDPDYLEGKEASVWAVMARREADLAGLVRDPRRPWVSFRPGRSTPVWTDDFSNLLSVLHWTGSPWTP